ncbi:DUF2497 domain-containing protein [Methylocystis echinoides]|uniref:DUF2497 domain-containing protein n=1 Tax=Methylocystis echinoides TaxID=29468 RepID=A0A9W6GUB2_9HYPH|nr:hypothetical protein LMG27198_21740 [Methylocystis echinoides]
MEEILASIRRIIADDQTLPGNRREREERRRRDTDDEAPASAATEAYAAPVLDAPPHVDEDVADSVEVEDAPQPHAVADIRHLRLSRTVVEAAPQVEAVEVAADVEIDDDVADEPVEAFDVVAHEAPAPHEPVVARVEEPIVSATTASSVASHFEALATSMIIKDQGLLQQYAQEMMRPMLKQWLDDNLPTIVERLVRAEIERVARGGRR